MASLHIPPLHTSTSTELPTGQGSWDSLTAPLAVNPCLQSPAHPPLADFYTKLQFSSGSVLCPLKFQWRKMVTAFKYKGKIVWFTTSNTFIILLYNVWMTPLHPNPQFCKECWSPTVPEGFCCNINSSLVKLKARWEQRKITNCTRQKRFT